MGIASVAAAAKVAKVVRKVKMLHWDKLQPHTLRGTVWEGANADDVGLNLADLDSLFALEDASRKKKDRAASGSKRPKAVSLIDPKRSLNISIQLAGLRMPFKRIKEALLKMDDETLAVDQLTILALAVPTQEELGLLRAYQGDRAELATVEQYFLQVMPIPRLAERIAKILGDTGQRIETIEGAGRDTFEVTREGQELAARAASSARDISEHTRDQSEQSQRAAGGMEQLASLAEQASRLTTHTRGAAEGLRRHAQRLEALLAEFHG